jgi:hypothetical protein
MRCLGSRIPAGPTGDFTGWLSPGGSLGTIVGAVPRGCSCGRSALSGVPVFAIALLVCAARGMKLCPNPCAPMVGESNILADGTFKGGAGRIALHLIADACA